MGLTNEHVGSKIVAKIKIYILTRAELLFNLCYEIYCTILLFELILQFLNVFFSEEFLHSAQMMSQITPLEVDILFVLCDLLHQTG